MKKVLFTLLCVFLSAWVFALEPSERSMHVRLYFEGGQTGRMISSDAVSLLKSVLGDTTLVINSVSVTGWASPDGPEERNVRISVARVDSVVALLRSLGLSSSATLSLNGAGEQWEPIAAFLDTTSDSVLAPYVYKLQSMLSEMPLDRREWMVRQEGDGRLWDRVVEGAYPACRYADVVIGFEKKLFADEDATVADGEAHEVDPSVMVVSSVIQEANHIAEVLRLDTLVNNSIIPVAALSEEVPSTDSMDSDPVVTPPAGTFVKKERVPHYVCALRTNLLMPATNLGLVFHFGRKGRTSLAIDAFGPWLGSSMPENYRLDIAGAGLEVRYWLRDFQGLVDSMTGLSIGLSGRVAMWDVQWNGPGCQGEGFTVGVDGSWTVKAGYCRFMFTLGLGFCNARWRPYHMYPGDDRLYRLGEWHETLRWLGPVRAGVTLLVPFGKLR